MGRETLGKRGGKKSMAKSGGGFGKLVLGFVLGIVAVVAAGYLYLKFGPLPVAVADKPFPMEKEIVRLPMHARIDTEKKDAPFGTSEDVFEGGARVYRAQCANCHGTPGHDVAFAKAMYPAAPQLEGRPWSAVDGDASLRPCALGHRDVAGLVAAQECGQGDA
jgi:mono/diheme cytochrome c family protein